MSDTDAVPSALGKRTRKDEGKTSNNGVGNGGGEVPEMPPADMDDSSDEEIGPMPTGPGEGEGEAAMGNGRKKKRRGSE
jgi:peptidylprolyl isomerase domain and WD repeat-containing protein 1